MPLVAFPVSSVELGTFLFCYGYGDTYPAFQYHDRYGPVVASHLRRSTLHCRKCPCFLMFKNRATMLRLSIGFQPCAPQACRSICGAVGSVMRRMGLEPSFHTRSINERGLEIIDSSGKRRAYYPANRSGKWIRSFTPDFEILRGDLCRLLYGATADRVKYVFGTILKVSTTMTALSRQYFQMAGKNLLIS
jgi:hypothetical protein